MNDKKPILHVVGMQWADSMDVSIHGTKEGLLALKRGINAALKVHAPAHVDAVNVQGNRFDMYVFHDPKEYLDAVFSVGNFEGEERESNVCGRES